MTATCINGLRAELFHRISNPKKLPPTQDCLLLHILHSHYQTIVCLKVVFAKPELPLPEESGWEFDETECTLRPKLMTLDPVPST